MFVFGSECVLCACQFLWVWGRECLLFVGEFGVGLWEWVCVVCGRVWFGFVGLNVCCV